MSEEQYHEFDKAILEGNRKWQSLYHIQKANNLGRCLKSIYNYSHQGKISVRPIDLPKVAIYSVFGGVPYYNQFIDGKLSVKENIVNLVASSSSRLLTEAKDFITLEINKMANANEAFADISVGNKKFSDILNRSHVTSSPALVDVLKKLKEMDAIR